MVKNQIGTQKEKLGMAVPENIKIPLAALGRRYGDLLIVNAWLNHKTSPNVTGMAVAAIKQVMKISESWIKAGIQYEADQDGISFDAAWARALGRSPLSSDRLDEVAKSVGCADPSELLNAIASGDVKVSRK